MKRRSFLVGAAASIVTALTVERNQARKSDLPEAWTVLEWHNGTHYVVHTVEIKQINLHGVLR